MCVYARDGPEEKKAPKVPQDMRLPLHDPLNTSVICGDPID